MEIRPVDHALGDEVLVRDQEFAAVAADHRGVARAHGVDPAEAVADGDDVARLDRLVGEQDDAADQVRHDLLQAEADADADRAGEDRQRREVDADRAEHDQHREGDQRGADQLAEQHLDRRRQVLVGLQPLVEEVAERDRAPEREQQQRRGLERQQRA